MPKLRRRLRVGGVNLILPTHISNNLANNALNNNNNNLSTDTSGVSQASSSQSVQQQDDRPIIGKQLHTFISSLCVSLAYDVNDNDDDDVMPLTSIHPLSIRLFFFFCCSVNDRKHLFFRCVAKNCFVNSPLLEEILIFCFVLYSFFKKRFSSFISMK